MSQNDLSQYIQERNDETGVTRYVIPSNAPMNTLGTTIDVIIPDNANGSAMTGYIDGAGKGSWYIQLMI